MAESYYVHGWHLGEDGKPEYYTIAPTGGGQMTTVSPGVLFTMYNQGLISSIQDIVKKWLNLPTENPYQTGTNIVTIRMQARHKTTGEALQGVECQITDTEDNSSDTGTTGLNGYVDIPNQEGGRAYNAIINKSGYATIADSFNVEDDISFLTKTYDLTPVATEKQRKRLTVEFNSFVSFIPISSSMLAQITQNAAEFGSSSPIIVSMANAIKEKMPDGWEVQNLTISNTAVSMDFVEIGSDPLTLGIIAGIVLIIAAALVTLGFIVKSWKLIDLQQMQEETNQVITSTDAAEALKAAGFDDATISAILSGALNNNAVDWQKIALIAGGVILASVVAVALINRVGKA